MKNAIVTGANGKIGRTFVDSLVTNGYFVYALDLNTDGFKTSKNVELIKLDITEEESVHDFFLYIDNLSVLINNAGIGVFTSFEDRTAKEFKKVMEVNLLGSFLMSQSAVKIMKKKGGGKIVNIASILGLRVGFGHSAYAVSKAGIVQMTRSMALELASKNIRVNALCPGYIETEINADFFATDAGQEYLQSTPAGRVGKMTELDGPLLLLCSDAGSFINGIALPVDGGHLVNSL